MENLVNTGMATEDKRLWIGNLDPRVTDLAFYKKLTIYLLFKYLNIISTYALFFVYWYQLLKLVQKHGSIEKFDLILHRNGPLAGQPRGYAFVTYKNQDDAVLAKEVLHNLLVGQKNISVTWAHSVNNEEPDKPKDDLVIPALAMSKAEQKTDRTSQIQAIEAKLKMMEKKREDELKINETVATKPPVISQYQQKTQNGATSVSTSTTNHRSVRQRDRYQKPYTKSKYRR
ncbi:probable RNA-binding protein 18 [Diabrotica virgifera virgifera]|uniref:RRM domain-containing protein n=1 Tax=Diabrotica virgifera virgifera TaxID=50390 RepID=A0ABM5KSA0_DIAVI|nr:probable RNA-binding protein 18 [Diabrotica virgifera virgifera]